VFVRPISDYPEIQFLFFLGYPPEAYQREQSIRGIEFLTPAAGGGATPPPGLALVPPWEPVAGALLATIRGPDSQVIWHLYRVPAPPA